MVGTTTAPVGTIDESRWRGKRLSFLPYCDASSGYMNHAAQLFKHWESLGVFVSVRPTFVKEYDDAKVPMALKRAEVAREQLEDWQFVLSPASYKPMQRKLDCVMTMFECSRWTPKQVKLLNRAQAVIVPCEWNRQSLRDSGCITQVFKVPLGFDDEVFKPSPVDLTGPCVFGAAGKQSHGAVRKGINAVIDAFQKEFTNEYDVKLKIKGLKDCPTRFCYDKSVQIVDGFLTAPQLSDWYSSLTCFVTAARGEGFGLMPLEAAACGRPSIAARYGGLMEFLTPDNCFPIDYKEGPSEEAWSVSGGQWAIPDEAHLRHLMRRVYNDRAEAQRIGLLAAETTKQFTWRSSAIRCLEVMEELGAI